MNTNANNGGEMHIEEKKPGIFGRAIESMQAHPIPTSLGLGTIGGAVALGGYNLRRYGTVLPPHIDHGQVVMAAASRISSLFGR